MIDYVDEMVEEMIELTEQMLLTKKSSFCWYL
jgi:hypothetical protein